MKNKSLILIVCLVLLVFGFTTATAEGTETVTTITCKPGSLLSDNTALNQICETAAIRIQSMPEGYGAFSLMFNGVDTLQSLFRFEENGFYLQSAALGKTPLYFSWEDLMNLVMDQLENNPELSEMNGMFNPETLQSMMDGSMTDEQALDMMGVDQAMLDYISEVEALETVETGSFTLNGSDTATQKSVVVLTKDELIKAVELPLVYNQISSQLRMSSPSLSEEELATEVQAQLDEVKQSIEETNLAVTTTMYTANDEFVAFELVVSGVMDNYDGSTSNVGMTSTVTKTTVDQAAYYHLSVLFFEGDTEILNQSGSLYVGDDFVTGNYLINSMDGEPVVSAALGFDASQADQKSGEISATFYDSYSGSANTALVIFDQTIAENTTDTVISLFAGAGDADSVKAALSETDVLSLRFTTVTQPDSGYFSDLQNATPETSVQLAQMTEDELNVYMAGMQQSLMMTVLTLIDNLPPEISDSLMQGM